MLYSLDGMNEGWTMTHALQKYPSLFIFQKVRNWHKCERVTETKDVDTDWWKTAILTFS